MSPVCSATLTVHGGCRVCSQCPVIPKGRVISFTPLPTPKPLWRTVIACCKYRGCLPGGLSRPAASHESCGSRSPGRYVRLTWLSHLFYLHVPPERVPTSLRCGRSPSRVQVAASVAVSGGHRDVPHGRCKSSRLMRAALRNEDQPVPTCDVQLKSTRCESLLPRCPAGGQPDCQAEYPKSVPTSIRDGLSLMGVSSQMSDLSKCLTWAFRLECSRSSRPRSFTCTHRS